LLLYELGAEVAAVRQTVTADDRQCDMMSHACGLFVSEQVSSRRFEELHHRRVIERWGIRHVDDHRRATHDFGESLAGERVNTGRGGGRHSLVALLTEIPYDL